LYHGASKKLETGVSGEYGSFQVSNGANGWSGMSIGGATVFMGNGTDAGIWNDSDNEWMLKCNRGAATELQYNGTKTFETVGSGTRTYGGHGINASTGSNEYLYIKPNGNTVLDMRYELNSDTDIRHKYYDNTGTYRGGFNYTTYANSTKYPNKHDSFYWLTDPSSNGSLSTAMRLTREGYLVKEKHPCFSVFKYDHAGQVPSGAYVFNSVSLNNGNHYNTSNGRFTAPVAGFYFFHFTLQGYGGGSGGRHVRIQLNGTDYWNQGTNTPFYDEIAGSHHNWSMGQGVQMAEGDYVTVTSSHGMRGMQSGFSGFLVG